MRRLLSNWTLKRPLWVVPLLVLGCSGPQQEVQLGVRWHASETEAASQLQTLGFRESPPAGVVFPEGMTGRFFEGEQDGWKVKSTLTFDRENRLVHMVTDHTLSTQGQGADSKEKLRGHCHQIHQGLTTRFGGDREDILHPGFEEPLAAGSQGVRLHRESQWKEGNVTSVLRCQLKGDEEGLTLLVSVTTLEAQTP